jgi:hypothetical protein
MIIGTRTAPRKIETAPRTAEATAQGEERDGEADIVSVERKARRSIVGV